MSQQSTSEFDKLRRKTIFTEVIHARAVLGAQIALYLDRMINSNEREQMKVYLLSAAEAISMLRNGTQH